MKKLLLSFFVIILVVCCACSMVEANDLSGRLGLGFGNPYIALKYGVSSKISSEVRAAFGEGVLVYGIRGYYNFNPHDKLVFFIGGELDAVNFKKSYLSGRGEVLMFFVGLEHFVSRNSSLCFDIGPAYISLHSGETISGEVNSEGIEWVYNLGFNFYLGSSKERVKQ